MPATMKRTPDDENEVHDLLTFTDPGHCTITTVARWTPEVARVITDTLRALVQRAHHAPAAINPDGDGITRAQTFEEGDVYMLASPYDGYEADRYLMDFYDVTERGICSRMHLHTGLRFVRMMTGPDTTIRVSSLAPIRITHVDDVTAYIPHTFTDDQPDVPAGHHRDRFNAVVPENSWVDMQVPRGVSHQFNAHGPHAVIDSVHPEESVETFRERMSTCRMTAQTVFLADERPPATTCQLT